MSSYCGCCVVSFLPSLLVLAVLSQHLSTSLAWTASATNNNHLVSNLHRDGRFRSERVGRALQDTDRGIYAPKEPYNDSPQPLGYGATISAPHMHAFVLDALEKNLSPEASVLDVGCGSGVLLAAFARMVGQGGTIVGVEHIDDLALLSKRNIDRDTSLGPLRRVIRIVVGDGREGEPRYAPYDAIHVGAAAAVIPPALIEQLKPGGRMIIPVGVERQEIFMVDKASDGTITTDSLLRVRYVPLTDADVQLGRRAPRKDEF